MLIQEETFMNSTQFFTTAKIGQVVQIVWKAPIFDPDAVIKPGEKPTGLSKVFTCGFVAFIDENKEFISIGIDSMFEGGSKQPSFRTILNIPAGSIEKAEIYGNLETQGGITVP